jgi:hypothetical protein
MGHDRRPVGSPRRTCAAFSERQYRDRREIMAARMLERGEGMTDQRQWYAGVDWASESHHVFLTDGDGRKIGEKV